MSVKKKILFGLDESDFARQALIEIGHLQKDCEDLQLTIFHGAKSPNFSFITKALKLSPDEMGKHQQLWFLEHERILEKNKEALSKSEFDPKRVETLFEQDCNNPSEFMMKLADSAGFETVAVSRWGATKLSRQVMGPVTYRLANMVDIPAVWVMDPRVRSHDVLVTLVGAPISRRVMDYTIRYFSHLKESRFTFYHVVPPLPPQCWDYGCIIDKDGFEEQQEKISQWLKEETNKVTQIAEEGRQRLLKAGVSDQNIVLKIEPQEQGIARDILNELEAGDYGVLVLGRKGSKNIKEFELGSKANKLLHLAHTLVTCMVS